MPDANDIPDVISGGQGGAAAPQGLQNNPASSNLAVNPAALQALLAASQGQGSAGLNMNPNIQPPSQQAPVEGAPPNILNPGQYASGQIASLQKQKDIQQDEAANQTANAQQVAELNARAAQEDADREVESKAMMIKAMSDAKAKDKEIRESIKVASAQEVDPDRYWNSKSTSGKILAGIGIILSGVGMGIAHHPGENPAMQLLQQSIDRDIDAQKGHMENSWKAIQQTHQLDDNAFNRDLHNVQWQQNFRTAAWERIKFELASRAAMSNSQTVQNNAAMGIQDITQKQNQVAYQRFLDANKLAQAGLAQNRADMKDAMDKVTELDKLGGNHADNIAKVWFDNPFLSKQVAAGNAPSEVRQVYSLLKERNDTVQKLMKLGVPQDKAFANALANPKFAPIAGMRQSQEQPIIPRAEQQKEKTANVELNNQLNQLDNFMKSPDAVKTNVIGIGNDQRDRWNVFVRGAVATMLKNQGQPVDKTSIEAAESIYTAGRMDSSEDIKSKMELLKNNLQMAAQPVAGNKITISQSDTQQAANNGFVKSTGPAMSKSQIKPKEKPQPVEQDKMIDKNFDKLMNK